MSSILSRLKDTTTTVDAVAELKDFNGGGFISESGIYDLKIEKAFLVEAASGSIGIYVKYVGDATHEDTIYISNKDGQTFYTRNGKDMPMPSYVDMKKLNYIATGEMISSAGDFKVEERLVKHYKLVEDPENDGKKKRVDDEITAEVLVDWIGKEFKVSIQMAEKEASKQVDGRWVNQGVRAEDKDGNPYLDVKIINYFNKDTNKTASESLTDKEATQLDKDIDRLEKSPIRVFKAKKSSGKTKSSGGTSTTPKKPSIF